MNRRLQWYIDRQPRGAQKLLADRAGISRSLVCRMLQGETVSARTALRIEQATGGKVKAETVAMKRDQKELLRMIRGAAAA